MAHEMVHPELDVPLPLSTRAKHSPAFASSSRTEPSVTLLFPSHTAEQTGGDHKNRSARSGL